MPVETGTYGNARSGETQTVTLTCGALKAVFCDFGARLPVCDHRVKVEFSIGWL
ncbi:MAG: hypothetical protein OXN44_06725 [Acidimicrobiaceae bacterium]|nr:hypothetical protein [Acidimicrobiaceae bacterium]MDE0608146.1 hypothetical protein [Acidimicrobiaceae bacterium]